MSGKGNSSQELIIESTEGVCDVTDADLEAHSFRLTPADWTGGAAPKVSAWKSGGLGAITITVWEKVHGHWNQVFKDGAALELSATNPQEALLSYGVYAVGKASATTGVEVVITRIHR